MKPGSTMAMLLLALVAGAHFIRMALAVEVTVGTAVVPMWVSGVGTVVTGTVAAMLWREGHRKNGPNPVP